MARRKNENKQRLIGELIIDYNIKTAADIQ